MRLAAIATIGLVLASAFGCAGMAGEDAAMEQQCAGNAASVSLSVEPGVVQRGAEVALSVSWATFNELTEPVVATLTTAESPTVRVTVPLVYEPGSAWTYAAAFDNPFGALAPAGVLHVLAEGALTDCRVGVTATTALALE